MAGKARKTTTNETKKSLIRRYFRAYGAGGQNAVNEFLHPKHKYYPPGESDAMSLEERVRDESVFFKAFSNIRTTVQDQVAEGRKVVSRVKMVADHTGEYQNFAPTGRPVTFAFIDFSTISSGKIIEEWAEFDMMSVLGQLRAAAKRQR